MHQNNKFQALHKFQGLMIERAELEGWGYYSGEGCVEEVIIAWL